MSSMLTNMDHVAIQVPHNDRRSRLRLGTTSFINWYFEDLQRGSTRNPIASFLVFIFFFWWVLWLLCIIYPVAYFASLFVWKHPFFGCWAGHTSNNASLLCGCTVSDYLNRQTSCCFIGEMASPKTRVSPCYKFHFPISPLPCPSASASSYLSQHRIHARRGNGNGTEK